MDSTWIQQPSEVGPKTSRLPAGSMLTLPNGVQVPHPHAEVSLPGGTDVRAQGTAAVDETLDGKKQQPVKALKLTESQAAANLIGIHRP